MVRIFLVHGWGGSPEGNFFPWLKSELQKKNFEVYVLPMPNPAFPKINDWVPFLSKAVGKTDKQTFFLGHSIGCQTILRYIATLPENSTLGGAVFIAGWTDLKPESYESENDKKIALPWLKTKIDFKKVKLVCKKITAIFSDDDPFVDVKEAVIFDRELNAKIIIEKSKGHYDMEKVPSVLNELLKITEKK